MSAGRHRVVDTSGAPEEWAPPVVAHLRSGGLLAHPTSTVFGLGGLLGAESTRRLAALKGRPREKPFLVLLPPGEPPGWVDTPPGLSALAAAHWPGPLTLVVPWSGPDAPAGIVSGEGGVAVRRDGHPRLESLLAVLGEPMTSSSLNTTGEAPAASVPQALAALQALGAGEDVWILSSEPAGGTGATLPSTIVDLTTHPVRLLREGAIPWTTISTTLREAGIRVDAVPGESESEPVEDTDGEPFRVLFVCTGNTCRSPMAEVVFRDLVDSRGWTNVEVASAGVFASPGAPASRGALDAVQRRGLDLEHHRARLLDVDLAEAADLILTMTAGHRDALEQMGLGVRAATLGDFAMEGGIGPGPDVPDPIGAGPDVYDATLVHIRELLERTLDRIRTVVAP